MKKPKLCVALAASLLTFSISASAGEDAHFRNLENRVNALEAMKAGSGMVNPSARPVVKTSADVNIFGELLFMKAEQGGMEFALRRYGHDIGQPSTAAAAAALPIPNAASGPQYGKVISSQSNWDWGLRIGMGYNMVHDGWDIAATWMRFHTIHDATNTGHGRAAGEYVPLIVPPMSGQNGSDTGGAITTGGTVTAPGFLIKCDWVTQRWRLNLDTADLEVGREFFVSRWMTLRPFIGPRAAFINQHYRPQFFGGEFVSLFDGSASQTTPNLISESASVVRSEMRNRFWGCGPRLGIASVWGMGYGLSIYGNADMSILWGHFRVRNETYITQQNGTVTQIVNFTNNRQARVPTANLMAGIRYDHVFGEMSDYGLAILLGYEHNLYWDQNQAMKFDHANSFALGSVSDDLSLAGLHFGALFDF
jgi:hypothetical protein